MIKRYVIKSLSCSYHIIKLPLFFLFQSFRCRDEMVDLRHVWRVASVIRGQQEAWRLQRWQKLDSTSLMEATDTHAALLEELSPMACDWDVVVELVQSVDQIRVINTLLLNRVTRKQSSSFCAIFNSKSNVFG